MSLLLTCGKVPSTNAGISSELNPKSFNPFSTPKSLMKSRTASAKIAPASSFFEFLVFFPKNQI